MRKLSYWLIWLPSTLSLVLLLYWFSSRESNKNTPPSDAVHSHAHTFDIHEYIQEKEAKLSADYLAQVQAAHQYEGEDFIKYGKLAAFWKTPYKNNQPINLLLGAYYDYKYGVCVSSSKVIIDAARLVTVIAQRMDIPMMRNGLLDIAKQAFTDAYAMDPDNDSILVDIGSLMLWHVGDRASPMEGVALMKQVIAKNPKHLYARYMLGLASMMSSQYQKAESHFLAVLSEDSQHLSAMMALARLYEIKQNEVEAKKLYRRVASLTQDSVLRRETMEKIKNL